jgi:hypothetical protein
MKTLKRFWRWLTGDRPRGPWEVRRSIWPHPDGYATYNPETKTVLDTGLSKERAQAICDEMNEEGQT